MKKLIDLSYMKTISAGNRGFELKLLKTFIEQTSAEIEKIYRSNVQKDWNSIGLSAHKIKQSFHYIGALKTEILLNTIETIAGHKEQLEKLPELVNTFLGSCNRILEDVKEEIKRYQAELGDSILLFFLYTPANIRQQVLTLIKIKTQIS
jgi:HPt (histidine-containing phosphotransfer) domain-containing protein